jgi:hypothetical protein
LAAGDRMKKTKKKESQYITYSAKKRKEIIKDLATTTANKQKQNTGCG